MAARDVAALESAFSDPCVVVHHATGVTFGRREQLASWKSIFKAESATYRRDVLATLGDSLELWRHWVSISGLTEAALASFGTAEFEEIVVGEDDGRGRYRRFEIYPAHRLGDAVARLYERHAELLPAGAARARVEATARSVKVVAPGQFDLDHYADVFLPDLEIVDHRMLGHRTGMDRQTLFRSMAAAGEVGDQLLSGPKDVLGLTENALLLGWLASGVGRASGGAFEWAFLRLFIFDCDGRVSRYELFDADREAEALARFDALAEGVGATTAAEPFANAASRSDALLMRRFNERDWAGVEALAAPELVVDERRRMMHNTCGREIWLQQFRVMFDLPASRFTTQLVATRGERLSLNLHRFAGEVAHGGGPLEMEGHFAIHEVDREGRIVAIVLFDQNDEAAAHTELDARFDAGEGAAHARGLATARARQRAFANRDWDAWGAPISRDYRYRDHRLLGWGTRDAPEPAQIAQSLVKLAPDVRQRLDHLRLCERGGLQQITYLGTRDGGEFEIVFVAVTEIDSQGRLLCNDTYGVDQLDQARARFDALFAEGASHRFANAASRANLELNRCFNVRDWAGIERLASPDLVFDERRRLARNTCGREVWLEQFRVLFDLPASRFTTRLLATRGERLSLSLDSFAGEVADGGGPLELEDHLVLLEVDGGSIVRMMLFDQGDLDAAYAELDARFEADEDRVHAVYATIMRPFARAIETRDWRPLLALCAPTVVEYDNRGLAVLGTTRGAEAWLENFRVLGELAPDSRYRVDHFRSSAHALCTVGVWIGTREGGPYEMPLVAVLELDVQKRIARGDIFDTEQLEQARARFDELATAARAPARFENAATRQVERTTAAFAARDWQSFGAFFAPEFRNYDRRAMVQLEIDREQFLESYRQIIEITSAPPEHDLLATRGDRLALVLLRWQGAAGDIGPTEIDWLLVVEVDTRGDGIAGVTFGPGDIDAAYAELDARFEAGEGAVHPRALAAMLGGRRALEARNWEAFAARFARGFVCHDHRVLGWATLQGVAEFVRAQQALVELAPNASSRNDHVAILPRGTFQSGLVLGTRDGGAFEIAVLRVTEIDEHGLICRVDIYDTDQLDQARVRFAELRPTNAAAETMLVHWQAAFETGFGTGDWGPMRALCTPDMVFDDRRRVALLRGDRELMIASVRERAAMGARAVRRVVETYGDRVALSRTLWSGGPADGPFEIESIAVVEVDTRGRIQAIVLLEGDELPAAQREAARRAAAIDAPPRDPLRIPENAAARNLSLRVRARADEATLRSLAADDFCFDDRGRRALVRGGIEEWLSALRFLVRETGAQGHNELVATAGDRLALHRVTWREAPGQPNFQLVHYRLTEIDAAGKLRALVLFDADQRTDAHAELFERYVANGADGMPRGLVDCLRGVSDHDLVRVRAALSDDLVIDDHRRAGLGRVEGADAYVASLVAAHELSADLRVDVLHFAAAERHACAFLARASGTNTVGGAFESFYVALARFRDDKVARFEFFEPEQLDEALARFEALRPDPLRVPETTATRARARQRALFLARDWEKMRAHAAEGFVFEDRGRRALVSGDIETWIRSMEFTSTPQFRVEREHLAALGDRVCIDTVMWHSKPGDGEFEFDRVRVVEVDADGRLRAVLFFDPEDRAVAFSEAMRRFATGEASASAGSQAFVAIWEALNARDWQALRDGFTADLVVSDHRPIGLGVFDRDGWVRALQAAVELSVGLTFEIRSVLAWNENGVVIVLHRYGSIPDGGGPFENFSIAVVLSRDNRVSRYELFGESEVERALARFAELTQA